MGIVELNRKFYNLYQYVALLVIFPLITIIWYRKLDNIVYTILSLSLPIITAYIVPAIGTNVTNLWEFNNNKFMMGKFRLYHGFVLGSATSLFGYIYLSLYSTYTTLNDVIISAFYFGVFMSVINFIYDAKAIECEYIIVHNKPAYEKKNAYIVAADYAIIYFFTFGFIYASYLKILQHFLSNNNINWQIIILMHFASLIVPTMFYAIYSKLRHKTWGISKYKPTGDE